MDSVLTIRIIAGVLAVIVVAILVSRRKNMASARRMAPKR